MYAWCRHMYVPVCTSMYGSVQTARKFATGCFSPAFLFSRDAIEETYDTIRLLFPYSEKYLPSCIVMHNNMNTIYSPLLPETSCESATTAAASTCLPTRYLQAGFNYIQKKSPYLLSIRGYVQCMSYLCGI
jgi:hypothetical protein